MGGRGVKIDHEALVRMLVLRPVDWSESDMIEGGFSASTMWLSIGGADFALRKINIAERMI